MAVFENMVIFSPLETKKLLQEMSGMNNKIKMLTSFDIHGKFSIM